MTIAIPAVILAGLVYSRTLKHIAASPLEGLVAAEKPEAQLPGIGTSLLSALLPVILLMLTTFLPIVVHPNARGQHLLWFVNDPSIILLVAISFATYRSGSEAG
jgi:Gnt-I system high-affinity gluconate transporter